MLIQRTPLLSHIFSYFRKRIGKVLLTLLLVGLSKLAALAGPFALKYIVDSTANVSQREQITVIVLTLVIGYVLAFFSSTLFNELASIVSEKIVQPLIASIGKSVFSRLISLPHESLIQRSFGETIKDIDRGLKSLQSLVALSIHTILPLVVELTVVFVFTIMYYDFYFALLLSSGVALHFYFTATSSTNIAASREELNNHETALAGRFSEAINNLETIKIFNSEKYETLRFTTRFHFYAREAIRYQLTYSKTRLVQQTIVCGILLALMVRAGWSLSQGGLSPGDFVLINTMAMQVLIPISFTGTVWKELAQFLVDVKVFSRFLATPKMTTYSGQDATELHEVEIKLETVSYAYNEGSSTLKDITIDIPKGGFVAIIGSSGSGKSTILKLMAGLIAPKTGRILINGKELNQSNANAYIQSMAMVPQNVVLFHGSIADNIKYSNRHATEEDVFEVARRVQLHDRVLKFSQGYQTAVGERGLGLSGGERQLLGIARALLKRPKILLLDEPSSALDAETEAKWIENLQFNYSGITRVVVTHRLPSIKNADKIFVIERGKVVEQGTHLELLKHGQLYARLWESQVSVNLQ